MIHEQRTLYKMAAGFRCAHFLLSIYFNRHMRKYYAQGRANPGVQGVLAPGRQKLRGSIFFYVWQSSISVLCYGAAFIILHQGGISTGHGPATENWIWHFSSKFWAQNRSDSNGAQNFCVFIEKQKMALDFLL